MDISSVLYSFDEIASVDHNFGFGYASGFYGHICVSKTFAGFVHVGSYAYDTLFFVRAGKSFFGK